MRLQFICMVIFFDHNKFMRTIIVLATLVALVFSVTSSNNTIVLQPGKTNTVTFTAGGINLRTGKTGAIKNSNYTYSFQNYPSFLRADKNTLTGPVNTSCNGNWTVTVEYKSPSGVVEGSQNYTLTCQKLPESTGGPLGYAVGIISGLVEVGRGLFFSPAGNFLVLLPTISSQNLPPGKIVVTDFSKATVNNGLIRRQTKNNLTMSSSPATKIIQPVQVSKQTRITTPQIKSPVNKTNTARRKPGSPGSIIIITDNNKSVPTSNPSTPVTNPNPANPTPPQKSTPIMTPPSTPTPQNDSNTEFPNLQNFDVPESAAP